MYWTNRMMLVLMSSACCCFVVSSLNLLDHENVKQSNINLDGEWTLPSSSLRFNNKESTQVAVGASQFAETKHLEISTQRSIDKQTQKSQYKDLENRVPVGTRPGNSYDAVLAETSNNDHVNELPTSSVPKYPKIDYIYNHGDQNGAFTAESDQWFNDENDLEHASLDVSQEKVDISKSHGDVFSCLSCNCSYTANRFVIANCTSRRFHEFPLKLPINTMFLNMSANLLQYLNASNFLHYPDLLNVTMTSNMRLTEILNDSLGNQTSKVRLLNLTSCAIQTIQDGSFGVTPDLTYLIIRNNKLKHLNKSAFKGLGRLQCLDLSMNGIVSIEVGTFNGLEELLSLDLSDNKNLGYSEKRFSPLLFTNLKHLQRLSIHGNSDGMERSYPNTALQELIELMELSIDGLDNPVEFGPGMKSLKKLVSLEIRGNCRIQNITETFFENIPHLMSFLMDLCASFVHVHPEAYTKLGNLKALSISNMKSYDIDTAFQDLTGLNNSLLKSITFNHLERPQYQCKYLGTQQAQYLKDIRIEHLDLSGNSIVLLGNDFLVELPKTLKSLILKRNKFTSSTQSMNNFAVLTALTELDLSMQNMDNYYNPHYSSPDDFSKRNCLGPQFSDINEDRIAPKEIDTHFELEPQGADMLALQDDLISTNYDQTTTKCPYKYILQIPPKLKTLRASQYNVFGMQILTHRLPKNNSLSVIDFSNSFMSTWGTGSLPPGIRDANLGYNYCTDISRSFFQTNNSHLHLFLNNNFLGNDFADDVTGQILSKLSKTVYLDISSNLIYKIPKTFFAGLSSLRYLQMSDNRLSILNASFAHMKTLQFIDLSRNSISWIEAETRNDLDAIAVSSENVLKIDLTMNPLPCTCDGLELISWMATTKVHFHNKKLLKCYPNNRVPEPMGDLENRRQQLQRSCMAKSVFIIAGLLAFTVVMVIVIFGLMYRYRWKLRYLHNTAMASLFGFKPDVSPKSGCTFDAYFVYTTGTRDFVAHTCLKELEVKRGHRLCVEDRDFLAGTYIVSSILSAVRNSTKTVVVMTPDLFKYPYCTYSFKMAVMEELYKHRSVLHLLLYQPVPSDEMSHDLLKVMKRNSYTEYPPDEGADDNVKQMFWDKLSQTIGHSGSDKSEPVLDIE